MQQPMRVSWLLGIAVASIACNALLGLEELPRERAGAGGAGDGTTGDTLGLAGAGGDPSDNGSANSANGGMGNENSTSRSTSTDGMGGAAGGHSDDTGGTATDMGGATSSDGVASVSGSGGTNPINVECAEGETSACAEAGLLGACAEGTRSCRENGTWGECSIQPLDTDSCEQNNDDTCNGVPNEDCDCVAGAVRPCRDAHGNCASGSEVCGADGTWGACDVQAQELDTCEAGDDSNCNGIPNEGCPCIDGQSQQFGPESDAGRCEYGLQECVDGQWQVVNEPVYPASVDCISSEDNDCDGRADDSQSETCACAPGSVEVCESHPVLDGQGICKAGSRTCVAGPGGATSSWGSCTGAVGPRTELCNNDGVDEDCDGNPSNSCTCLVGQTRSCQGAKGICAQGIETCTSGGAAWSACSVSQRAESCNGLDDDCDGSIDEGGVCQTCLSLPDLRTASSAYLTLRDGDREFSGHGPTVNLRVALEPDGQRVCATVYTRMRETESNYSLGDNTRTVCTSNAPGEVVQIISPSYERSTTLSGHGWHSNVMTPSGVVQQVDCVGDGPGDDICSNKSPPDCAVCYVNLGCVEVMYSP